MKKCKRWIAVVLVVMLCLPLCGCQSNLEDMRAAHAVWQEDGSILWNGNVYRELPNVPEGLEYYYGETIYVTEADVPVLLSEMFGQNFTVDSDGVLIHSWYWKGDEAYFCREDEYTEILEYLLQEVKLDTYFYTYWDQSSDNWLEKYYYLTDEQREWIEDLTATLTFTLMDEDFYLDFEHDEYSVVLGKCDEKHLFSEYHVLEIVYKQGKFYLAMEGTVAEVPTEQYSAIRGIVKTFYKAEIA